MVKRRASKAALEQTPPEKKSRRQSARLKEQSQEIVRAKGTDIVGDGEPQSTTSEAESSVVYLGHIPHGFYENQIREYFSQFGDVLKVRVSRSKATAKSKGYAFLQFESAEVAKIAAEAMHDYLMFGQKLVCKIVPLEEVHPHTFKGANQRFKKIPWRQIESERHNKERTKSEEAKRQKRLASKDLKRRGKIAAAGIDYEFEGYVAKKKTPVKDTKKTTKTRVSTRKATLRSRTK